MSRSKRFLTVLLSLALVFLMVPATALAANDTEGRILVYANLPDDWANPCIWAWADDGTNAFDAWPGGEMEADPSNEGWYYCWIPQETNNIIINANEGSVQTSDYKLETKNAWVTVTDADTVDISYDAQTTGDLPEYVETFKVHAKVPESWQDVGLWAWSAPDGTNAFSAWPGKAMKAGDDGWYTASAPVWVNSIIVNGNSGGVQTEDLSIDPAEIWVTVAEDGTAEFTYNDPDAPQAEDITVYVKVPADWSEPNLWAWSAPDGTNAFASWPGEALQEGDDGWYSISVPGWINSVIVNGNGGSIQTADLSVETGKDLWVVVTDAENAAVTYEEPADTDVAASSSSAASSEAASSEAPASSSDSSSSGSAAPVAIAIAAIAAVGAGGYAYTKKKKS